MLRGLVFLLTNGVFSVMGTGVSTHQRSVQGPEDELPFWPSPVEEEEWDDGYASSNWHSHRHHITHSNSHSHRHHKTHSN